MYPRLLGLMAVNHLTQADMSSLLGIARTTWSRKVSGEYDFTITEMRTLSKYFGDSMDSLFEVTE